MILGIGVDSFLCVLACRFSCENVEISALIFGFVLI